MSTNTEDADDAADAPDETDDTTPDSQPSELSTIIEAGRFGDIINVLQSVSDECIFHLGRDGLGVTLVDPANVYMIDLDADASAFENTGDGSFAIGVNLSRLDEIVGKADSDQLLHFVLDLETRKFHVEFGNAEMNIAGIDPDSVRNEPDLPDLDLPNEFDVEAKHLQYADDICTMFSDHVDIQPDPDAEHVRFDADGDIDDGHVDLSEELEYAHIVEETESLYSTGDGGYLTDALGVIPSDVEVHVEVGEEFPLIMEWSFADDTVDVRQMIAPRIRK